MDTDQHCAADAAAIGQNRQRTRRPPGGRGSRGVGCIVAVAWALAGHSLLPGTGRAAPIPVPNASFESPVTPFVSVEVDVWQKSPKPDWYQATGEATWDQLMGLFHNPAPGSPQHIENCDGAQAAWLFAVPEVALFLDHDAAPASGFDARFEVSKSYQLTVGVIGMGGSMLEDVPLEISLYYRDDAGNPVTVAATTVINDRETLGDRTRFVDFSVQTPEVKPGDAWAGRYLGVRFRSQVSFAMQGGFWDLDHVRLQAFGRPVIEAPAWSGGQFEATIVSEPGAVLDVLASAELTRPVAEWKRVTTVTNETGTVRFTDAGASDLIRFYQARLVP